MGDTEQEEALAYRRVLGGFATGVVLVTTDGPTGPAGIVVNSFTSVSLRPRLVLWCLGDASDRFDIFASAEAWAINVLCADQHDIAARFARPGSFDAAGVAMDRLGACPALPGMFGSVCPGSPPRLPFPMEGWIHWWRTPSAMAERRWDPRPCPSTAGTA